MAKKQHNRLYKPFAANLRALRREFKRCSEMYLPLYHDRLMAWSSDGPIQLSSERWAAFVEANREPTGDDGEWWCWDAHLRDIGRFSGNPDGLTEFRQLAESACIVLQEMGIDTEGLNQYAWLEILHDVGFRQKMPLLRSDMTLWGFDEHPGDEFDELVDEWHTSASGKREYPLHPCQWSLAHSVFISSMALLQAILDPDTVLLTSSTLEPDYVLELLRPVTQGTLRNEDDGQFHADTPNAHSTREKTTAKGNVFQRTVTGVWKLRYTEEGKIEEDEFEHEEGFVIYQQLLCSSGLPVLNRELRDYSKRDVPREGDSVVQEQDLIGELGDDEGGFVDGKWWGEKESQQEVGSAETVTWMRQKWKELDKQLEEATSADDLPRITEIQRNRKKLRKLMNETITDKGKLKDFATGNRTERNRSRVAKALSLCRKTLEPRMPLLHAFLKRNVVPRSGTAMQYLRADKVTWAT